MRHPRADQEKRSAFCQNIEEHRANNRPLVFIDESGFSHDMPRTHGYSKKGKRCFGLHDWGAKGRTNVIGALLCGSLIAVSLIQRTVNTVVFNKWIIEKLIPELPKHSVVIMDNATFHKGKDMVKALEDAGHTLMYLPPYSPDLNPIEKKWAQAKAIRRRVGGDVKELFDRYQL